MEVAGVKVKYDNTSTKARNSEYTNIVAKNTLEHESFIYCLQDKGHILHNLALVTILVLFLLLQVRSPPPQPKKNYFSFSEYVMCAQSLSHVQLFETPWTVARRAPLSMGVSINLHPSQRSFLLVLPHKTSVFSSGPPH